MIILPRKRKAGKRKMSSDVTMQDVFERFLPEYAESKNFSDRQYMSQIRKKRPKRSLLQVYTRLVYPVDNNVIKA